MTAQKELTKVIDSLPDLDNINALDLVVYFLPVFEKVEIYEGCRAFYADKDNWIPRGVGQAHLFNKVDTELIPYRTVKPPTTKTVGGRHARECGEKIKAIDKGFHAHKDSHLKLETESKKLQAKIEIYEKYMTLYADKNNWYGQDLASSEGRYARECIEKIKAIDNAR